MRRRLCIAGLAVFAMVAGMTAITQTQASALALPPTDDLTLWYNSPATDWETQALPIGNGPLGAKLFGGVASEQIQFNEKTLWTGGPGAQGGYNHGNWTSPRPGAIDNIQAQIDQQGRITPQTVANALGQGKTNFGSYQTFGDLFLDFANPPTSTSEYRRELSLREAIARVGYTAGGVEYTREYFASNPGNVIVARISANQTGRVSFTLRHTSPRNDKTITASNGRLTIKGALANNGLKFEAQVQVVNQGGTRTDAGDRVTVTGANSVLLVLSAGTSYSDVYPTYRGADPAAGVTSRVTTAAAKSWDELKAAHLADYKNLFDRVKLNIGQSNPTVPTNTLRANYTGGSAAQDRALEAMFFAYGRYLLISSSRENDILPANLQGVWNNVVNPPWDADYHVNINLQMNYWPAEQTNLRETTRPYDRYVNSMVAPGRVTAQNMYGARGWVVNNETNPYGFTGVHNYPQSFWFPEAAAWTTQHLYDSYRFNGDVTYLRDTAYPAIKGAAEFWLDFLHTDPRDNRLVVSPSYSPENGDFSAGASMSQQIVREVFTNALAAARTLNVDASLQNELTTALSRLDPGLRIGRWGQLQEWKTDWDSQTDTHRHVSHLFALHPGNQILPGTAEANAARVSLNARGDGGTGWSKAWKINFWARLLDGNRAHKLLSEQLKSSTLDNLWDTHPPFQIDGNFGATSGVAEMLVQSQHDTVHVLPALPSTWANGSVTGLKARGDVTVDTTWKSGAAETITLRTARTAPIKVRTAAATGTYSVKDETGATVAATRTGDTLSWNATAGKTYTISFTTTGGGTSQTVEGEAFTSQSGVQPAGHATASGGQTVGYIDNGDWAAYSQVSTSGLRTFSARVSSGGPGGTITVRAGSPTGTVLGSVAVAPTGSWDTFTTVSTTLTGSGSGPLHLVFSGGSGSLLDVDTITVSTTGSGPQPQTVQGEAWTSMSGVQQADHPNAQGGYSVGYIDNGDWTAYSGVNTSGLRNFSARVSSAGAGGTIQVRSGSPTGTLLGSVAVAPTGGWDTHVTVSTTLTGSASGPLHLVFTGGAGSLFDVDSFTVS
ncbi:glycosyl hydrolase family 95 catalytic domain-containing protein [Herbidospora galbida]|uniref:glycosyl hydrolase family 95 catalytic domain-containing protein n=1 Tax=Herbidospora galbida TaxID=2575442 RepID=UPI001BB0363F|nr:glycoside hydrolase N-terminal domain-containing protein [Herbidospora galbida]